MVSPTLHKLHRRSKRPRCWTEYQLDLQYPTTAFNFTKARFGHDDDNDLVAHLPCRILHHWFLTRQSVATSKLNSTSSSLSGAESDDGEVDEPLASFPDRRVPLPLDNTKEGLEEYSLVGTLKPMHPKQEAVQIELFDLQFYTIDTSSRGYRGYWMITPHAKYWLQQPCTKKVRIPRLSIRVAGETMRLSGGDEDRDEEIYLPSQDEVHTFHRAQLGLLSNIVDLFLCGDDNDSSPKSSSTSSSLSLQCQTPQQVYDVLSPPKDIRQYYRRRTKDIGQDSLPKLHRHPFDLQLLQSSRFLHQFLPFVDPTLRESTFCKDLLATKHIREAYTFPLSSNQIQQLRASAEASEKRSQQKPWGERLFGPEGACPNLSYPLELQLEYYLEPPVRPSIVVEKEWPVTSNVVSSSSSNASSDPETVGSEEMAAMDTTGDSDREHAVHLQLSQEKLLARRQSELPPDKEQEIRRPLKKLKIRLQVPKSYKEECRRTAQSQSLKDSNTEHELASESYRQDLAGSTDCLMSATEVDNPEIAQNGSDDFSITGKRKSDDKAVEQHPMDEPPEEVFTRTSRVPLKLRLKNAGGIIPVVTEMEAAMPPAPSSPSSSSSSSSSPPLPPPLPPTAIEHPSEPSSTRRDISTDTQVPLGAGQEEPRQSMLDKTPPIEMPSNEVRQISPHITGSDDPKSQPDTRNFSAGQERRVLRSPARRDENRPANDTPIPSHVPCDGHVSDEDRVSASVPARHDRPPQPRSFSRPHNTCDDGEYHRRISDECDDGYRASEGPRRRVSYEWSPNNGPEYPSKFHQRASTDIIGREWNTKDEPRLTSNRNRRPSPPPRPVRDEVYLERTNSDLRYGPGRERRESLPDKPYRNAVDARTSCTESRPTYTKPPPVAVKRDIAAAVEETNALFIARRLSRLDEMRQNRDAHDEEKRLDAAAARPRYSDLFKSAPVFVNRKPRIDPLPPPRPPSPPPPPPAKCSQIEDGEVEEAGEVCENHRVREPPQPRGRNYLSLNRNRYDDHRRSPSPRRFQGRLRLSSSPPRFAESPRRSRSPSKNRWDSDVPPPRRQTFSRPVVQNHGSSFQEFSANRRRDSFRNNTTNSWIDHERDFGGGNGNSNKEFAHPSDDSFIDRQQQQHQYSSRVFDSDRSAPRRRWSRGGFDSSSSSSSYDRQKIQQQQQRRYFGPGSRSCSRNEYHLNGGGDSSSSSSRWIRR